MADWGLEACGLTISRDLTANVRAENNKPRDVPVAITLPKDVRFGSLADIGASLHDVRFTPEADII
jgi:hypothetical protein